jgi:hypothetical protein
MNFGNQQELITNSDVRLSFQAGAQQGRGIPIAIIELYPF